MKASTIWLLGGLAAAVGLWVYSRTQRGQQAASDLVGTAVDTSAADLSAISGNISEGISAVSSALGFTPRGVRNNNPGNLDYIANPARAWNGQSGSDGRFGVYDTPADGVRALSKQLQVDYRRGYDTLAKLITEWAPASENNTGAYIDAVANETGLDPNAPLDLNSNLPGIAAAIIQHENGEQPYDPNDIAQWVYAA